MTDRQIPTAILGATGYVGGELLRLLAAHPSLSLHAALSTSRAGKAIGDEFAPLAPAFHGHAFRSQDDLVRSLDSIDELALFSAAPHGASAESVAEILAAAKAHDVDVHVVDCSADFRYTSADAYAAVYGQDHGAPQLLDQFQQGLPEHVAATNKRHVGHPGCFATAALLASVPLCAGDLAPGQVFLSGITGSTGSGKSPLPGTHHPERHSNLYAYKPLSHRHAPEIAGGIAAAGGGDVTVSFVPHSGPFARGIHMTLQARLANPVSADALRKIYEDFYSDSPFITVIDGTPRLKDVVTSNHCRIGVAAEGETVVVCAVIDNLVKGAAGGAVQWMNRLWGLPEDSGLRAPAAAWT